MFQSTYDRNPELFASAKKVVSAEIVLLVDRSPPPLSAVPAEIVVALSALSAI